MDSEQAQVRPDSVKVGCTNCGLKVERIMRKDAPVTDWLCPDCDPDKGEDEEPHESTWLSDDRGLTDPRLYGFTPGWIPRGFQEEGPRRLQKKAPDWVMDDARLREFELHLLGTTRGVKCYKAARAIAALRYYYRVEMNFGQIGATLRMTANAAKSLVKRLKKRGDRFFGTLPPEPDPRQTLIRGSRGARQPERPVAEQPGRMQ